MIPYSPIKLLEFSYQPIRVHCWDSCCCCIKRQLMRPRAPAAAMDQFFIHGKIISWKVCIWRSEGQENVIFCTKSFLFHVQALWTRLIVRVPIDHVILPNERTQGSEGKRRDEKPGLWEPAVISNEDIKSTSLLGVYCEPNWSIHVMNTTGAIETTKMH